VPRWRVCGGRQRLDTGRLENWKTGRLGGGMEGSGQSLFLRCRILHRVHRSCACPPPPFFFEPDCCVKKQAFPPRPPSQRPTDLLLREPTRAGECCNGKTSAPFGGTALGLAQGARSKEWATERFDVLQLLAVNYSMSRGGFGGLVASGRVLRPQRRPRCDGSHGMRWDGMETWSRGS
jgi:hypothetical protein